MKLVTWIGLICVLLTAGSSRASVVYSNLGPGDSFQRGNGGFEYQVYAHGGTIPRYISVASSFTTGPHSWNFEGVELPLEFFFGDNSFVVWLMSDSNGLPGGILQRIPLSGIPAEPSIITAPATAPLVLNANTTYWVALLAWPGDASCFWYGNDTATGGSAIDDAPIGWIGGNVAAPAMRVNGTIVPEPAVTTLVTVIAATLLVARRKRSNSNGNPAERASA